MNLIKCTTSELLYEHLKYIGKFGPEPKNMYCFNVVYDEIAKFCFVAKEFFRLFEYALYYAVRT